jgi:hypothetical protein
VAPTNALGGAAKLGQCWIDTTSATLPIKKRYTGSGWVVEGVLDVTNGIWIPPVGGGVGSVASSGTTDLCASPQHVQNITGTTTITSFGSSCAVGTEKAVIFGGVLTLTYNATSLIIPLQTSKTTAAGDIAIAVYLGSGNWRVLVYIPITGAGVTSIDAKTGPFTTGKGITSTGGNVIQLSLTGATLQLTPGNQPGSSGAMMGHGVGCAITPVYSSRVEVRFQGGIISSATGATVNLQAKFGTGTAPANGAGSTGTSIGSVETATLSSNINSGPPFGGLGGIITGLTPGTAYWFDIFLTASTGTASLINVSCSAVEL